MTGIIMNDFPERPAPLTEFSEEKPGDTYVQSLARGLAVIRSFSADRPAQTLSQVAELTGLSRAGARRILLTLETLGYARTDGRLFSLTPKILNLGFSYLSSLPFWQLAQPIMENLAASVKESCSICVLEGWEALYVLRVPTRRIMTINLSVGSRLPAYCTSMGRVLLAGLTETELEKTLLKTPLKKYTRATITDIGELRERIALCRSQGWVSIYRELEEGLVSVAAPIVNRQGQWIAAMNISGHAMTYSEEEFCDRFLAPLRDAARAVSDLLI